MDMHVAEQTQPTRKVASIGTGTMGLVWLWRLRWQGLKSLFMAEEKIASMHV